MKQDHLMIATNEHEYRAEQSAGSLIFYKFQPLIGLGAFAALMISILTFCGSVDPAAAGTETGEWCLTCPDWTNYEAWLEWKAAQEAAQESIISSPPPVTDDSKDGSEVNDTEVNDTELEAKPETEETAPVIPDEAGGEAEEDFGAGNLSDFLVPISNVSPSDLILDISPQAEEYIEGAININYEAFLEDEAHSKSVSEIAEILGKAGISRNDSVIICGECLPCGGGPVPATYTYWLLKYIGHEKVRILDGDIEDWKAAGHPTSNVSATRAAKEYIPKVKTDLLATYEYVKSGDAQIVDARSPEAANSSSIPGSVNIPTNKILDGEKIKGASDLKVIFKDLSRDRPVVVYTNTGVQATVSCFALDMMGYNARLYSWWDWLEYQPPLDIDLAEVAADPNPAKSGESIRISAVLAEPSAKTLDGSSGSTDPENSTAGCVSCGVGSLDSSASFDPTTGMVRVGKSASDASSAIDSDLKCTAIISGPNGMEVGRERLLQTTGGTYVGVWGADLDPGVYSLNILAELSGSSIFRRAMDLEITD